MITRHQNYKIILNRSPRPALSDVDHVQRMGVLVHLEPLREEVALVLLGLRLVELDLPVLLLVEVVGEDLLEVSEGNLVLTAQMSELRRVALLDRGDAGRVILHHPGMNDTSERLLEEDLSGDQLCGQAAVEADHLCLLSRPGNAALLLRAPCEGEASAVAPLNLEVEAARRLRVLDIAAVVRVGPRHQDEVVQVAGGEAALEGERRVRVEEALHAMATTIAVLGPTSDP